MKTNVLFLVVLSLFLLLNACSDNQNEDKLVFNLVAVKNGEYGILNQDGDEILPFVYGELSTVSENGVLIHKISEDDFELINLDGDTLLSDFDRLHPFYDYSINFHFPQLIPYAFYGFKDGQHNIYDSNGDLFYSSATQITSYIRDQFIAISDTYYVEINDVSKILINTYDSVIQKGETYFAENDNNVYVLDYFGQIKHTYLNHSLRLFDDIAVIENDTRLFVFDSNGDLIIDDPSIDEVVQVFDYNYLVVTVGNLRGLYDLTGTKILDAQYDDFLIKENFFVAQKGLDYEIYYDDIKINTVQNVNLDYGNRIGYKDIYVLHQNQTEDYFYYKNNLLISSAYKKASPFNEMGFAAVQFQTLEYAIIDTDFNIVHQVYDEYKPYGNFFVVKEEIGTEGSKYGVINHLGDIILPIESSDIYAFGDYLVCRNIEDSLMFNDLYILNQAGLIISIFDLSIQEIKMKELQNILFTPGFYVLGYINHHFEHINGNQYEIIDFIHDNFLIATKDGKVGVIDSNQNILVSFDYDQIYGYLPIPLT